MWLCETIQVNILSSIYQLPRLFWDGCGDIRQNIFVRDCYDMCYGKLYTIISDLMFGGWMNHGVALFTDVPGISKYLFLVYFSYRCYCRFSNRFPDKRFAFEFDRGNYWYFQPNSEATLFSCTLQHGNYCTFELKIFDIRNPVQPLSRAKGRSYSALLVLFATRRFWRILLVT